MENYEKIKKIGTGSYGGILLVRRKLDRQVFALKKVVNESQLSSISPYNEVKLLESLTHPNIIKYYDSFTYKNKFCILMEYAENGDLQQQVIKARISKVFLDEELIMDWIAQLCLALKYLHDKKILHRDIKLQNIFLNTNGIIKLGDFGISKKLEFTGEFAKTALGTPYYLSPEICSNSTYNHLTDIWMLGCVIYELCMLERPFIGDSLPVVVNKILHENPKPLPERCSLFLRNLVKRILSKKPHLRPSIDEILEMKEIKEKGFQHINTQITQNPAYIGVKESNNDSNSSENDDSITYPPETSHKSAVILAEQSIYNNQENDENLKKQQILQKNSIHSIIEARKITLSPTNSIFQAKSAPTLSSIETKANDSKPHIYIENTIENKKSDEKQQNKGNIENTFGMIYDDERFPKKTHQKYQKQISINTSVLESNYNKKENSTTNKNNIPTERVMPKTFNFVNTIFNPKSPNSPNRSILFSEYLIQRLGETRFKKMKSYLETHKNPLKVLEENKTLVIEIIGEENLDCIKIFNYLMSSVVTPSKSSETMIRMQTERQGKIKLFEEFKRNEEK